MSQGPPRRTFLRVAGSAILASIAGCTADENPTHSPSESPTESPTPSPTPTPEPVGTGSNPDDIVVVNRIESAQSISVQIDQQGGSTVFSETFERDGGERTRRDIFDNDATGVFVIIAQLSNGTEETYGWDLSEQPEDGWVYVSIEAEDVIEMTYTIA